MIKTSQFLSQKQLLGQKLSPQQIQYIKLLQLPTVALEQRIKEELENNPILEEGEEEESLELDEIMDSYEEEPSEEENDQALDEFEPLEDVSDIEKEDWDEMLHADELESYKAPTSDELEEIRELPKPYQSSLIEDLEDQISLLDFTERQLLIANQIIGSLDSDGYFRRDIQSVIDTIAFNHSTLVMDEEVEEVLKRIQKLDPIGIAARNLQECMLIQLQNMESNIPGRDEALLIVDKDWNSFEKKHYQKLMTKYDLDEEDLKDVYHCIRLLDPKPGHIDENLENTSNYVIPDFEVYYQTKEDKKGNEIGEFVINLNQRNAPQLKISPQYESMWEEIKKVKEPNHRDKETQVFIKSKMDSAKWFIESIKQRQNTLLGVMKTLVAMQETFFRTGSGLKPLILKDIADRIGMDISTISRVANGKYVQTPFGVFELKYFFNEKLMTSTGEEIANREVKDLIEKIIQEEDKSKPLSDQVIADFLTKEHEIEIARRTVAKYREQLNLPVARLRKEIV